MHHVNTPSSPAPSGCKARFKITATGKVRFFPPGGRHHKYKLSGRQVQNKRKPRFLNSVDGKRIKLAMLQGRNWRPAYPPRKKLKLRADVVAAGGTIAWPIA